MLRITNMDLPIHHNFLYNLQINSTEGIPRRCWRFSFLNQLYICASVLVRLIPNYKETLCLIKQQDSLRKIADIIAELDTGKKLTNLIPGTTGDDPLVDMDVDPNTLDISRFYQRQFSVGALNSYKQYNPQLARRIVGTASSTSWWTAPTIDGQHTAGLSIYAGLTSVPLLPGAP